MQRYPTARRDPAWEWEMHLLRFTSQRLPLARKAAECQRRRTQVLAADANNHLRWPHTYRVDARTQVLLADDELAARKTAVRGRRNAEKAALARSKVRKAGASSATSSSWSICVDSSRTFTVHTIDGHGSGWRMPGKRLWRRSI